MKPIRRMIIAVTIVAVAGIAIIILLRVGSRGVPASGLGPSTVIDKKGQEVQTAPVAPKHHDEADITVVREPFLAREGWAAEEFVAAPEIFLRIDAIVRKLGTESVEESVRRLAEVDHYYWPGPPPRGAQGYNPGSLIPLPASVGEEDIHAIMSNRRFLKAYEELSKLPKSRAAEILNKEIAIAIAEHGKLFEDSVAENKRKYRLESETGSSSVSLPSFVIENPNGGRIVVIGAKLKVLSLVWIAGALGLEDSANSVQAVADEAGRQRQRLYADTEMSEEYKWRMMDKASLYNRQLLATALMGTQTGAGQTDGAEDKLTWQERRLTHYDERLTPYDLPVRSGIMDVKYLKGDLKIKHLGPMDDKLFEDIVRAIHPPE